MVNMLSMEQVAATVASCLGIDAPAQAAPAIELPGVVMRAHGIHRVERALLYNPDAMGQWPYQKHTEWFAPVVKHAPIAVPIHTMLPSVTPVCFGTMYTGVSPHVHGIERYEKHVLDQASLFDSLLDAGKRVALIAVRDSSMDILFSDRGVDRFIFSYDDKVNEQAAELIEADEHDVVVVYNQEFDDVMHKTYPGSRISLDAMHHHIQSFDKLCSVAERAWREHDALFAWLPDHGTHIADDGHGMHGSDREDDLNVLHFYGFKRSGEAPAAEFGCS